MACRINVIRRLHKYTMACLQRTPTDEAKSHACRCSLQYAELAQPITCMIGTSNRISHTLFLDHMLSEWIFFVPRNNRLSSRGPHTSIHPRNIAIVKNQKQLYSPLLRHIIFPGLSTHTHTHTPPEKSSTLSDHSMNSDMAPAKPSTPSTPVLPRSFTA